jgi:hypothetical protein
MAKRRKGPKRTMGTRSATLTLTMSITDARKVTDKAWVELQDQIDAFVEDIDSNTIFTTPINQEITYNREVEVRPGMYFE